MNITLLIDAIVRQTTVLIAQLATAAGTRATLAHTANQVFLDLVAELKTNGLGNKVIADMFGLSLRTYHHKVARLSESSTERGRSLWEALLDFVQRQTAVPRSDVLRRFAHDDEVKVRGVLRDLVDSGLVYRTGRGDSTIYRAASPDDYSLQETNGAGARLANLVWITVYRNGPVSRDEIRAHVPADEPLIDEALAALLADGRIQGTDEDEPARYESRTCVIAPGDPSGWEAAVFDHYQAMVTAITTKLRLGRQRGAQTDWVGGSTYGFEVWDGHPHRTDVLTFLRSARERAVSLREQVAAYNAGHAVGSGSMKVIAYVGQTVIGHDEDEGED
jgi:hypothetical protein